MGLVRLREHPVRYNEYYRCSRKSQPERTENLPGRIFPGKLRAMAKPTRQHPQGKQQQPVMSLSQRLGQARHDAQLTLDQLADESRVSKTYLWELEHDVDGTKRPSADVLLKLAEALKVTIADLLSLPSVQVNQTKIDLSSSLVAFHRWMKEIHQELSPEELHDLAAMRFRGAQPKNKEDWYDLYRILKRTTGK